MAFSNRQMVVCIVVCGGFFLVGLIRSITPGATTHAVLRASPNVTLRATTNATHGATPNVAPRVTPNVTHGSTPNVTPIVTPNVTHGAIPNVTRGSTPNVAPRATPNVTHGAIPNVAPRATPSVTPRDTPNYPKGFTHFETDYVCTVEGPARTCEYNDEVDLRIIVMVYDRPDSLSKCLACVKTLELDGAKAEVNIWLDKHRSGGVHNETLQVAQAFTWPQGTVRVHTHREHVGIMGNWIETWRPKVKTKELALFLEDDTDISPFVWRWLKAANAKYGHRADVGGFSMFDQSIPGVKARPENDLAFFSKRFGTNAYCPVAAQWRAFQDWFHKQRKDPTFHPYVKDDPMITGWYKTFERSHTEMNMWEMWPICYQDINNLYTVFPNIDPYVRAHEPDSRAANRFLGFHRAEHGLHQQKWGGVNSSLIMDWKSTFIDFPDHPVKYYYDGSIKI